MSSETFVIEENLFRVRIRTRNRCMYSGIFFVLSAALAIQAQAAPADLRLPLVFADHAVFQRNALVPVWGWARPGDTVIAEFAGQRHRTNADRDGRWRIDLSPMIAGGPHTLTVAANGQRLVLSDILVGEVWLASGQSNMQWSIKATENWEAELARSANDSIRFAMVYREVSPVPLDDLRKISPWARCNAESLADCYDGAGFSAVSYYFAKYLQAELQVPVGIVNTSWGGTRIEPWTPPEGFDRVPALAEISTRIRMNDPGSADYQAALKKAIADTEAWLPKAKEVEGRGVFPPAMPAIASASSLNRADAPTALYNAMVAPLVPFANRGFIWYQGESNRGEGMLYRDKMEALIKGWRQMWQQDDLACYFVQLAPYDYGNDPRSLPEIWEAQVATLEIPGTGMAVINDIGNVDDIHPRNKDDVGKRLALLALNKTYGKHGIVCDSPLFERVEAKGSTLRVYFKNARQLSTRDGAPPNWFTISGSDKIFHKAEATIKNATVVLKAKEVQKPKFVRFAWDHRAEPNLVNEAGLPASAFRAAAPAAK